MIEIDVNVHYPYSLDDWTVGSANRSIFVQEVVLQEYLFEICYNSHKNSKYVTILKNKKKIFICPSANKFYNKIHPKKIFHSLTSRLGSVMFEAISSIQ